MEDKIKFEHNMQGQIIGEIVYNNPYQFTFVYPDNRRLVVNNVIQFNAMKTGCYVLLDTKETVYVIRPNHDYVIEKPQPTEEA